MRHEEPPRPHGPDKPSALILLPPELADFLRDQDLVALFHAADRGTLLVLKATTPDLESLGGPVPIALEHQLWAHPSSPVVRSLLTVYDRPDAPLALETFTNPADPDQRATFAALADQQEIVLLGYDEHLRHRLSKRLGNRSAEWIPTIVAEADRLLAAIPEQARDFDAAKAAVLEVTAL